MPHQQVLYKTLLIEATLIFLNYENQKKKNPWKAKLKDKQWETIYSN